jgi:hypothetical protein
MLAALHNGWTTQKILECWPHLTASAVNSQRYLERQAGTTIGSILTDNPPAIMDRVDKKEGSFNWRDANRLLTDMQALKAQASSSQDFAQITIDTDEPIFCLFLSDTHIGDWATDYDLFMRITDEILETPNLYVGLLGDMVNMAINMRNVAEVTGGNLLTPELQAQYFSSWLDEIKDRVMFATWDNHAIMREEKGSGISAFKEIQNKRVVYFNGIGHPDIHVGSQTYKFAVSHRFRGASIENPCHSTMRYLRREGHDRELAAQGDSHVPGTATFYHGRVRKVAINTGSTQTNSGYAKRHFSLFTQPLMPGVLLYPDRHLITPFPSVAEWKATHR